MSLRLPVVDKDDNIIGFKDSKDLLNEDIIRVSALWITDSKERVLLAKRHKSKKYDPGKWGPAVSGTVEEGETYEHNILKEAEEEIGLKGIKPKKEFKMLNHTDHIYFTQFFSTQLDKPLEYFTIQEAEVEEIRWWTKEELKKRSNEHPGEFTKSFLKYSELFF